VAQRVVVDHDETKVGNQKGHCLLFVPTVLAKVESLPLFGESVHESTPAQVFLGKLKELRETYDLRHHKLHFTNIGGRKWRKWDLGTRLILDSLVDALRCRNCKVFGSPLCFKLAVMMYNPTSLLELYGRGSGREQEMRYQETVLRMLLKGASHFLFSDDDPVVIEGIVCDGEPSHRHLDRSRVIDQLFLEEAARRTPLRNYVTFAGDCEIKHVLSDHKKYDAQSSDFDHAHFLQMTDVLLGAILNARTQGTRLWHTTPTLGATVTSKKEIIAYPVREMLGKQARGSGFRASGHYRAFTLSELAFDQGSIVFRGFPVGADSRSSDLPELGDLG
jgi:hypothetical protein